MYLFLFYVVFKTLGTVAIFVLLYIYNCDFLCDFEGPTTPFIPTYHFSPTLDFSLIYSRFWASI